MGKSFWKFLAGFAALVAISFMIIIAIGYYETEIKGEPQTASVP